VLSGLQTFLDTEATLHQEHEGLVPLNYVENKIISLSPSQGNLTLKVHGYLAGFMAKALLKIIGMYM
jgi:hypothetical protein